MTKKVKFISYDGSYPNLCSGTLVLEINGKNEVFGLGLDDGHPQFWDTGGSVWFDEDWDEHVETGRWRLISSNLPDYLKSYASEMIDVFNKNVPWGCCGGCI